MFWFFTPLLSPGPGVKTETEINHRPNRLTPTQEREVARNSVGQRALSDGEWLSPSLAPGLPPLGPDFSASTLVGSGPDLGRGRLRFGSQEVVTRPRRGSTYLRRHSLT